MLKVAADHRDAHCGAIVRDLAKELLAHAVPISAVDRELRMLVAELVFDKHRPDLIQLLYTDTADVSSWGAHISYVGTCIAAIVGHDGFHMLPAADLEDGSDARSNSTDDI